MFSILVTYEFERTLVSLYLKEKIALKARVQSNEVSVPMRQVQIEQDIMNRVNKELMGVISNGAHDMKGNTS